MNAPNDLKNVCGEILEFCLKNAKNATTKKPANKHYTNISLCLCILLVRNFESLDRIHVYTKLNKI